MQNAMQPNKNDDGLLLKPNIINLTALCIGIIGFIYLALSWILKGSAGLWPITVLLGFIAIYGSILRFFLSPLSIKIEDDRLIVRKFFGGNVTYPLSKVSSVDYAFWISKMVRKCFWLRIHSENANILLSFLFFVNTGEFIKYLGNNCSEIVIDKRLAKFLI